MMKMKFSKAQAITDIRALRKYIAELKYQFKITEEEIIWFDFGRLRFPHNFIEKYKIKKGEGET